MVCGSRGSQSKYHVDPLVTTLFRRQLVATHGSVLACLRPIRALSICRRLLLVAPRGSIISAHGDHEGIRLTSGDDLTWSEIRKLLAPISDALDGNLIVSMSCCDGVHALALAMQSEAAPYFAIIGPKGEPDWSDTAVGFAALYHRLAKEAPVGVAIEAMCSASFTGGSTRTSTQPTLPAPRPHPRRPSTHSSAISGY